MDKPRGVWAVSDVTSLAQQVLTLATEKHKRVTCAESCTGGLVAAALTELPGSSAIFEYGFVTYSNPAKSDLLGVRSETLEVFGAVSEETVREMAEGALMRSGADLAVSISGIAGPGGSEFKPEGRVCFGLARRTEISACEVTTESIEFGALGRSEVRRQATLHALNMLSQALISI